MKEDVFERWEEHSCSLNPAKPAEPVSIEAEGAAGVQGLRHRLQVGKEKKRVRLLAPIQ